MPFTDNLPAENTNPWYTPLVTAWNNLKTFVNGLETSLASLAAQLDTKINTTARGVANGVASLGADGKLPVAQLPALAVAEYKGTVATQAAMLAITGEQGDWVIRSDRGTVFVITGNPAVIGGWIEMAYPTAPVTSVAGRTGVIVLAKADVGLGNVDNTSDVNKPVSTAQAAADATRVPNTRTVAGSALSSDIPQAALNVVGIPKAVVIATGGSTAGIPANTWIAEEAPA